MLFSVLTRKGSLKAQLSPCNVPGLVKGKQISASSSFSARFPHSAQPSSLTEAGIQHNRSSGSFLWASIWGDQFSQSETQKENHC